MALTDRPGNLPSNKAVRNKLARSFAAGICAAAVATPAAAQDFETVDPSVLVELDIAIAPVTRDLVSITTIGPVAAQPIETEMPVDVFGPQLEDTSPPADDEPANDYAIPRRPYASFGEDVKTIKWEIAAAFGYYTAINAPKLFQNPRWPTFQDEGWFGKNTNNLGVDKLAHAYSTYVVSELLHARLKRKTGGAPGTQLTTAAIASGVMMWAEAFDSIEQTSGWSWQDVTFNTLGAGFSALRNSVPGLDRKLDFRLMIEPNEDIYTLSGKEHFRQQRYLFALKASGFESLEKTPLRFVEFHLGYRADDFLPEDRAAGIPPKRHVFVGLGLNLRELLFKQPRSRAGRAAGEILDYFQPPYTALHHDITE